MEYDAIVIGSGSGGAAAAAVMAHGGLKVLLLEKNERIGGSCSYYYKDGFQVDWGTHTFGRGNKGPIGEVTRRCGAGEPIEFLRTDNHFLMRADFVNLRLPASLLRLPLFAYDFFRQVPFPVREIPNCLRLAYDVATMSQEQILEWDGRTLEEYVKQFTQDEIAFGVLAFFMGLFFILPPWKASAGESIWVLQKMVRPDSDFGYPRGGAIVVPRTFVEIAQRHGAKVITKAGVKKILVEKGRAVGVKTSDGSEFRARTVVSTTSLKDSVLRLTGAKHFPEGYVERVRGIEGSLIAVQVKVALDRPLVKDTGLLIGAMTRMGDTPEINYDNLKAAFEDLMAGKIPVAVPIYSPIPTNYDPSLAPAGKQLITACAVAPTTDVPLAEPPEAWIDALVEALEKMVPGLQEHALWIDRFSVKTCEAWIGKSGGAAITTAQTPRQTGLNRPASRSPLPGLFFSGDCAGGRGVGVELATQSGLDCAMEIIRDLRSGVL